MKKLSVMLLALLLCVAALPAAAVERGAAAPASPILVAYFSATGNTRAVAEKLQAALGADIFEIVPEVPYTDADLNWRDAKSRSSLEMNDPDARPAIAGELPDIGGYHTVLIGYPIWWGEAPRIVTHFVEQADLSDKTVAVFFTSGSSGVGSSMEKLEQRAGAGTWLSGQRFASGATAEELRGWAMSLGIAP